MAWCAPGDRQPQGWSATFRQVTASTASSPWSWARRAHQERTPSWYSRAPTLSLLLLLLPVTSPSSWPTWKRQEKWQSIIPRRDKCMAFAGWLWSRGDKDYSCSYYQTVPQIFSAVCPGLRSEHPPKPSTTVTSWSIQNHPRGPAGHSWRRKSDLFFKCLIHFLAPVIYTLATLSEMVPKCLMGLDGPVLCEIIQYF